MGGGKLLANEQAQQKQSNADKKRGQGKKCGVSRRQRKWVEVGADYKRGKGKELRQGQARIKKAGASAKKLGGASADITLVAGTKKVGDSARESPTLSCAIILY